jgi:transcriptional regulator with AAA-type ATPase domain
MKHGKSKYRFSGYEKLRKHDVCQRKPSPSSRHLKESSGAARSDGNAGPGSHGGAHDSTVLIEGETGTGKEVIASAIHACSNAEIEPS